MGIKLETKNKRTKLIFSKKSITLRNSYQVILNSRMAEELYNRLKELTREVIKNDDRPYYDDISTYANEIEKLNTYMKTIEEDK